MRRSAIATTILAGLAWASSAAACSVVPGYRVPTNLELAAKGQTIVVAVVTRERAGASSMTSTVFVRPVVLLKGPVLPALVEIPGARIIDDPKVIVTASDPRELRQPNVDALSGGCVRYLFRTGMRLVLFLAPDKSGRLVPFRSPFARDAEDVASNRALWIKAVREYAVISAAPRREWPARLARRITVLRNVPNNPDARAIANDMGIELKNIRTRPLD